MSQPNIPALQQALLVCDALKKVEGMKPKKAQWQIAQDLKIVPLDKRVDKNDTSAVAADKKNVMTAIVGRYKKRVELSIRNTGKGLFP